MTAPNEALREQLGYFHALSRSANESTQEVFEAAFKSAHSVRGADVWADAVAVAVDVTAADSEAGSNAAVTKHTLLSLTEVGGSNGQAYFLDIAGAFIKPWIAPTDVPDPTTALASNGYQALLYQSDDTLITPTEGVWLIDYFAGIVLFQIGSTPSDEGWGTPKITCYQYTGAGVVAGGGGGTVVDNEDKTGDVDGIETEFILASTPLAGSTKVYLNGMRQRLGVDYTETVVTKKITFADTPESDAILIVDYRTS